MQAGPSGISPSKISEQLGIPASSLSFHLKELTHAELIAAKQDGRYVIYAANVTTMAGLIGFLTENCCSGQRCAPSDFARQPD